jgi:hypothetical protein
VNQERRQIFAGCNNGQIQMHHVTMN